jgi:DNA-binding CsgD family transcriptional regulator
MVPGSLMIRNLLKIAFRICFWYLWNVGTRFKSMSLPNLISWPHCVGICTGTCPNTVFSDEFTDDKVQIFNFEFSVEERFIGQETILTRTRHLKQLLETLPPRQKEVIYLKFFQEMEREQIAEMMDIAPQTVSNLIQLALKQLRQYWKLELLTFVLLNLSLL